MTEDGYIRVDTKDGTLFLMRRFYQNHKSLMEILWGQRSDPWCHSCSSVGKLTGFRFSSLSLWWCYVSGFQLMHAIKAYLNDCFHYGLKTLASCLFLFPFNKCYFSSLPLTIQCTFTFIIMCTCVSHISLSSGFPRHWPLSWMVIRRKLHVQIIGVKGPIIRMVELHSLSYVCVFGLIITYINDCSFFINPISCLSWTLSKTGCSLVEDRASQWLIHL